MYKVHLSDTLLKHLGIARTCIRPRLKLFLFALLLPCLEKLGRWAFLFYELLYYALFLVKGISYNFVKATLNYSCIVCFVVIEHKNEISNW